MFESQNRGSNARVAMMFAIFASVALLATDVLARVGGGQSYGGGGGHGGGGGGAGALVYLLVRFLLWLTIEHPVIGIPLDIIVIALVIYWFSRPSKKTLTVASSSSIVSAPDAVATAVQQQGWQKAFNQLRRFDPNFSEIIFIDFCYALYGRAHEARGRGAKALDELSPYLSESARGSLIKLNPPNLKSVEGIIIGAMQVIEVQGLDTPNVTITLGFETNYTEVVDGRQMTYYVRERWSLDRKRDALSPTPEHATALHCPRCGAPLQKDTNGACAFCSTKIESGEFQWYVQSV